MTRTWTALVAPLGVASGDKRLLSPEGFFVLRRLGAPLRLPVGGVGGVVWEIAKEDGWLTARGTVTDPDVAAAMRSGELLPELALSDMDLRIRDDGVMVFYTGTVSSIVAGRNPAWPGVRFTLKEGTPE